jgi:orotidine-5'-phosphate decarboxylase
MSFNNKLNNSILKKKSYLCVGLDPDIEKIPHVLHKEENPIKKFVEEIVNATKKYAIAYKSNMAFFECEGFSGLRALESLKKIIPEDIILILDGKRGDIGNTANKYAKSAYELLGADAVTVNPYMGFDAVKPFIENAEKGVFVLGLTSNKSAEDFQYLHIKNEPLYMIVGKKVNLWNSNNNCGLVVGATKPEELAEIRKKFPTLPFLVPGVGAQGGDLKTVIKNGEDKNGTGLLINAGRDILYCSSGNDFAGKSSERAKYYFEIMSQNFDCLS